MDVSENSGTQIIQFNHYKPSILGYPYFWKHPYTPWKITTEPKSGGLEDDFPFQFSDL